MVFDSQAQKNESETLLWLQGVLRIYAYVYNVMYTNAKAPEHVSEAIDNSHAIPLSRLNRDDLDVFAYNILSNHSSTLRWTSVERIQRSFCSHGEDLKILHSLSGKGSLRRYSFKAFLAHLVRKGFVY